MPLSNGNNEHSKCSLEPINLHNGYEYGELRRQRVLCGWDYDVEKLENWKRDVDAKTRSFFWITLPASDSESSPNRVGHICLNSLLDPPELDLANPDKSVMEIATFFILPEYRYGGIGRSAFEMLESYATKEPYGSKNCKAVTINTISKRYTENDGDEWRGVYARRGLKAPPKGKSMEDWYARMGYVKWKEAPRYPDRREDGTEVKLIAVFMKKTIQ
jgi:GNAT superfamily N-acetyltransferase